MTVQLIGYTQKMMRNCLSSQVVCDVQCSNMKEVYGDLQVRQEVLFFKQQLVVLITLASFVFHTNRNNTRYEVRKEFSPI